MSTKALNKTVGHLNIVAMLSIAAVPMLMIILPWDFGDHYTPYRAIMKGYSLTPVFVEVAILLLLLLNNFSPFPIISKLPRISLIGLFLLIGSAVLTTVIVAENPIVAIIGIWQLIFTFFFALTIADWTNKLDKKYVRLSWCSIGLGIIGYCIILWVYIVHDRPQGDEWVIGLPGLTNVRGMGFFAVPVFFAGAGLFLERSQILPFARRTLTALLFGTIGLGLLIWTGSRGGLFAILISLILLLAVAQINRVRLMIFSGLTLALALIATSPLPVENPSYGLSRILGATVDNARGSDISAGRTELWVATWEKIGQRPWTGYGIDQFSSYGPEKTRGLKQPHNFPLQILFSTGLLGVLSLCLILIPMLGMVRLRRSGPMITSSLGCLFAIAIYSLYDAGLYYNYPIMIFVIALALSIEPKKPIPADEMSH